MTLNLPKLKSPPTPNQISDKEIQSTSDEAWGQLKARLGKYTSKLKLTDGPDLPSFDQISLEANRKDLKATIQKPDDNIPETGGKEA